MIGPQVRQRLDRLAAVLSPAGDTAPTGDAEPGAEQQAERVAAITFIASRFGQLAFSTLMVINDRRRYSRPVLQAVVLAGAWIESGWLCRRIVAAGRHNDPTDMWVDALTASAALLISQRGMSGGDGAPWPKNIAIGAAMGASGVRSNAHAGAIMATFCAAAMGAGLRARGRDAHVAGLALAVNDAVNWTGMHVASRVYVNAHRRYGRLRDEADALTVERAAAAATEAERSRQHELLHRITIGVLDRVATSTDLACAVSVARAEAARLRYALRTGGRVAQGLDHALAEIAQEVQAAGITVELVTAELDTTPSPSITRALRSVIRDTVLAAHEFGGANRAVVRVASTDLGITVTVRDHGAGFEPELGSSYESALRSAVAPLEPHGATAALWSEPGSGTRVHVTAPLASLAGAGRDEDLVEGGPDGGVGHLAAGDDNHARLDRDVEVVVARRDLEGAEDEVTRPGRVSGRHPGRAGDPLEPGSQQRLGRGNPRRRQSLGKHLPRMASRLRSGVVRTTQFDALSSADTRLADRTLLSAVLAWRAAGLATGAAALIAGRGRFRSRPLAIAQLAIGIGESIWYARRVLSADRWADSQAAQVDAATAAGLLVLGQVNLPAADRHTWINWAPWSFAANAMSTQAMGVRSPAQGRTGAGAVIATYAAQHARLGDAVANSAALAGFFGGSRLFAGQIRGGAVRLEDARTEAVAEGRRLAEARERSVQLRLLHDHALQTLETIASGRFTDLGSVLSRARAESDKLSDALSNRVAAGNSLAQRLSILVTDHAGLTLDFDCPESPIVSAALADALCGAANEALTNVRKHAGVDRATVAVRAAPGEVIVTITDQGRGFDRATAVGGFGMGESISRRMRDAGGAAEVESVPGSGTRVTLRGPA